MEIMLIKIEEKLKDLITSIQKKLGRHHEFIHTNVKLGNSGMWS